MNCDDVGMRVFELVREFGRGVARVGGGDEAAGPESAEDDGRDVDVVGGEEGEDGPLAEVEDGFEAFAEVDRGLAEGVVGVCFGEVGGRLEDGLGGGVGTRGPVEEKSEEVGFDEGKVGVERRDGHGGLVG